MRRAARHAAPSRTYVRRPRHTRVDERAARRNPNRSRAPLGNAAHGHDLTAKVLAREEKKDQEYVSSFLAQLRAKAIESMHALLEAEADDDDA